MTVNLFGLTATKVKPQPYNKKQAINTFVNKFKHKFDMRDDAIDLREMAHPDNYSNGIIPLQDVHSAITVVLGPTYQNQVYNFDPSDGAFLGYSKRPKEYFDYVDWNDLYLWPIFQRDVAPNHIEKIYKDFDPSSVIVPCIIRITLQDGKIVHACWDGHHTIQVCRLKGWTKFPAWIIDVDQFTTEEIENAGFGDTDDERVRYGCFIAGKNMRRINGLNKRPLSPYDDFMIGYETRDAVFVTMMNILHKHNCVPKRHATMAGAFTQIKSGIECYDLADTYGNKGQFWDRALAFHRKNWPGSHLVLEIFRPLSYLYHAANLQGIALPPSFDDELAALLIDKWGDAESVQQGIKDSYWAAYHQAQVHGHIPEHDKFRVLSGLINLYNQSKGQTILQKNGNSVTISGIMLPLPTCQWRV